LNANDQNVAVIAIHGVGQHLSGASADAVSTLLLSLDRNGSQGQPARYSGFDIKSISVPLRPVQSPPDDVKIANDRVAKGSNKWWSRLWGIFDERRGYLYARRKDKPKPLGYEERDLRPGEPDRGEYGYQFMLTQLAGYKGDVDRNFETVRLEVKRDGNPAANVHIYDAHYSDLTKPESSILAFFFSFYQLLFHLCSLSLMAVYWAETENVKVEKDKEEQREKESKAKAKTGEVKSGEKVRRYKPRIWRWRIVSSVHATSVRLLTMAVPILNVVLLEIACSAFIDKTYGQAWLPVLAFSFAALLSLGATFVLLRQKGSPSRPFLWALIPFMGAAVGTTGLSGISYLYVHTCHVGITLSQTLLLLSWLLTAGLILGLVAKQFDELRPGALWLSLVIYGLNLLLFLAYLLPKTIKVQPHVLPQNQLATASFWAVQCIFGQLVLAWISCLASAFLSWWPLSWLCKGGIENDQPRLARAIAAFRTGRFAFAVPAILFVIVTTILWSGVLVYGSSKLKAFDGVPRELETWEDSSPRIREVLVPKIKTVQTWIRCVESKEPLEKCCRHETEAATQRKIQGTIQAVEGTSEGTDLGSPQVPVHGKIQGTVEGTLQCTNSANEYWTNYLKGLLLVSVTPALPITMAIFAFALLLLIWAVLPSVIFEKYPEKTQDASSDRIRSLGKWLSRGLDNVAILTRLLWLAIVPVPLIFLALDWHTLLHSIPKCDFSTILGLQFPPFHHSLLTPASKYTLRLIESTGLYLAISAAAISTFILKSLTTVLDTILDVDNYLRTSPLDKTPRARIAERCTSLLRYIANYRDPQHRPYSKVIIVAHSLGSMVTTDLLRYLERSGKGSPDSDLARYGFRREYPHKNPPELPLYVFSMGSPLRQLLNRFFPHLYWWLSDIPDNSLASLADPVGPPMPEITSPPGDPRTLPRSDEMNATLWVNAYRSGDYIGRDLWVGQWFNRNASNDTGKPAETKQDGPPRTRREMCIGLGAHTHYWDRSAPDIAVELDSLISGEERG
jgi:hypothetical protein